MGLVRTLEDALIGRACKGQEEDGTWEPWAGCLVPLTGPASGSSTPV